MLKNISWTQFLIVVFFLSVFYYAVIGILFYGKRILRISGRRSSAPDPLADIHPGEQAVADAPHPDDFTATKEASDKIHLVIERGVSDGIDRQDLFRALHDQLQPYKRLQGTGFGAAIKNSITRELNNAGHDLSEQELDAIWSSE